MKKKAKPTKKAVGAVKKAAPKRKTAQNTHKDTKSHNVNIRVMSGIKSKNRYSVTIDNFENDTYEVLLPFNAKTNAIKALKAYGIDAARDRYKDELEKPGKSVAAYVYDKENSEIVTGYIVKKRSAKKVSF